MGQYNSYEDDKRAEAYSKLEFHGTYLLAYRDIPELIKKYCKGKQAVDFGCGTGRSTRFLKALGLNALGVDISPEMISIARKEDPGGDYVLIGEGDISGLENNSCDIILSAFTFDNIPTLDLKSKCFKELKRIKKDDGIIISVVSSPDIYIHEWVSFSTKDYPENKNAGCGDIVKIIITDIDDARPVEDIVWPDKDYRDIYSRLDIEVIEMLSPLADGSEPYDWVNETSIAPWTIYILR